MHEIAKHAHGEDAKQATAKRKLDNLGYIAGECGLSNNPERIQRLKNQLGLTESLAAKPRRRRPPRPRTPRSRLRSSSTPHQPPSRSSTRRAATSTR